MNARLLAELAHLFSLEAFEADLRGETSEAERLWEISDELHERCSAATERAMFVSVIAAVALTACASQSRAACYAENEGYALQAAQRAHSTARPVFYGELEKRCEKVYGR